MLSPILCCSHESGCVWEVFSWLVTSCKTCWTEWKVIVWFVCFVYLFLLSLWNALLPEVSTWWRSFCLCNSRTVTWSEKYGQNLHQQWEREGVCNTALATWPFLGQKRLLHHYKLLSYDCDYIKLPSDLLGYDMTFSDAMELILCLSYSFKKKCSFNPKKVALIKKMQLQ